MELILIIALVFFVAFLIESIFGFWGLVISFAILSFFMDTKDMIFLWMYVATVASVFIIFTDYKSLSKKVFFEMFPIAFIATVIWVFLFDYLSNILLLKFFAWFLLIFSIKSLFFDSLETKNKIFQKITLFFGGLLQGLFWTGWPFTVMAIKDKFKNKSELRTTMALFFIIFNIIRAIQLSFQGAFDYEYIMSYWWLAFILLISTLIGYKIHLKFNEKYFKYWINILILLASIILLLK